MSETGRDGETGDATGLSPGGTSGEVVSDDPGGFTVNATASGFAQLAALGQGTQINNFHAAPAPPPVVNTLVPPPTTMVGRAPELHRLRTEAANARASGLPVAVCVVHGPGGAGKTALVRALAVDVAPEFPDGRIEVDLYGFTPGRDPRNVAEVLGELLNLVGIPASGVPAGEEGRAQLWRSWLSTRRVLLVLDNARDAAHVRPLLPGGGAPGGCLVLVTSRNRLADLDAGATVGVETMPVDDAVHLLERVSGRAPGDLARRDLEALAVMCARLPLALRAIGGLLARLDPADLLEVMRSTRRPLENLPDADRAAAAAYRVSYDALEPALRRVLHTSAWHPGPDYDAVSVAALGGQPTGLVTIQLVQLLDANMLSGLPGTRYAHFDLFLGYTRDLVEAEDSTLTRAEGRRRLYAELEARLADAAGRIYVDNVHVSEPAQGHAGFPDARRAAAWLRLAADELTTAAHSSLAESWPGAWRFAGALAYWMHAEGRSDKAAGLYAALASAAHTAGDAAAEADALTGAGLVAWTQADYHAAEVAYRDAQTLRERTGDLAGQAASLKGLADVLRDKDDLEAAQVAYRKAEQLYRDLGRPRGEIEARTGLANVMSRQNEWELASALYESALELAVMIQYRSGQADALVGLADVRLAAGRLDAAHDRYTEARKIYEEIGNNHGLAYALMGQAEAARLAHGETDPVGLYAQALGLYQQLGFRHYQIRILRGLAEVARSEGDDEAATGYERNADALAADSTS